MSIENDSIEELLQLREEFLSSLIKRTEGPAELVVSPEVWIERKEARLAELSETLKAARLEREAAIQRYDDHLRHLEKRVEILKEELQQERDTIYKAVEESSAPDKPARPSKSRAVKRPHRDDV